MARLPTLPGEGEVLPRYVFLESLIPESRVLEVGAVSLTSGHSARYLRERGAESVVSVDSDARAYRLFICGFEPTKLATVSLTPLASTVLEHLSAPAAPARADPLGLAGELENELDHNRIGELESRTQAAIEDAERAQMQAAQ